MRSPSATRACFLGRLKAAFFTVTRYAGCTLVDHPLPEVREVGNEWRASA